MSKPALKAASKSPIPFSITARAAKKNLTKRAVNPSIKNNLSGSTVSSLHTVDTDEYLTNEDFKVFHSGIYSARHVHRFPFANRSCAARG